MKSLSATARDALANDAWHEYENKKNLSGMSVKELNAYVEELRKELRSAIGWRASENVRMEIRRVEQKITSGDSLSSIAHDALAHFSGDPGLERRFSGGDAFRTSTKSPKDVSPGDIVLFRSINMWLPVTSVKKLSDTDTRVECSQGGWDFSNTARVSVRNRDSLSAVARDALTGDGRKAKTASGKEVELDTKQPDGSYYVLNNQGVAVKVTVPGKDSLSAVARDALSRDFASGGGSGPVRRSGGQSWMVAYKRAGQTIMQMEYFATEQEADRLYKSLRGAKWRCLLDPTGVMVVESGTRDHNPTNRARDARAPDVIRAEIAEIRRQIEKVLASGATQVPESDPLAARIRALKAELGRAQSGRDSLADLIDRARGGIREQVGDKDGDVYYGDDGWYYQLNGKEYGPFVDQSTAKKKYEERTKR